MKKTKTNQKEEEGEHCKTTEDIQQNTGHYENTEQHRES